MRRRARDGGNGRTSGGAGFTLLELLTVMAIMFLIMGMTVLAFFGVVRTTALRGAVSNLEKVVGLARQYAITHRMRTYVLFEQPDKTNGLYIVCAQAGVHDPAQGVSPTLSVGVDRWKPNELVGAHVFNLTDGSWATVTFNGSNFVAGALGGGKNNNWCPGDRYGWEIHDAEFLPSTLRFNNTGEPDDKPETIVFLPDGTTAKAGAGDYSIKVKEIRGPGEFQLTVRGLTGMIE